MTVFSIWKVSLCLRPSDVLLVTYNHMDAIRGFACDNPVISNQVENVYKLLYEVTGCQIYFGPLIVFRWRIDGAMKHIHGQFRLQWRLKWFKFSEILIQ